MSDTDAIWDELTIQLAAAADKQFDPQDVRRETTLADDLGLSSLMVINLVLDLEQKFGITVRDEDFDFKNMNVVTAGDVEHLIEANLGRSGN